MSQFPVLITTSGVARDAVSGSSIVHVFPNQEAAEAAIKIINRAEAVPNRHGWDSVFLREAVALFEVAP